MGRASKASPLTWWGNCAATTAAIQAPAKTDQVDAHAKIVDRKNLGEVIC
jgi:hypothetical protein